jgi:hypothetical protein
MSYRRDWAWLRSTSEPPTQASSGGWEAQMLAGLVQRWLIDLEARVRALGAAKPVLGGLALILYARLSKGSWPEQEAISRLFGLG